MSTEPTQPATPQTDPQQSAVEWVEERTDNDCSHGSYLRRSQALELAERCDKAETELERERNRLVACGIVALCDTPDSAKEARKMHPDYESASCDDVKRRVDECIDLRVQLAQLAERCDEAENKLLEATKELLETKLPEYDRCETCNIELGPFGPLGMDGEPTMDCIVCILRAQLAAAQAMLLANDSDSVVASCNCMTKTPEVK